MESYSPAVFPKNAANAVQFRPTREDAVTPLPTVTYRTTASMSTPAPGSFAASLRAIVDEARADIAQARTDGAAKVHDAVGKMKEAAVATAHVSATISKTMEDEAADVMAELGQISNDLGGTADV